MIDAPDPPLGFDWLTIWMTVSAVVCIGAAALAHRNLARFRIAPEPSAGDEGWSVTVCIPARNEEANLEACVRSVLAAADADSRSRTVVMVYDDGSTDATGEILARLLAEDDRVVAARTTPLPIGWNGKQHACDAMGRQCDTDWMLFTDADVRFAPDALRRTRAALVRASDGGRDVALFSAFPRERTGTVGESLIVPLIHVVLLAYLPFGRMRSTLDPAASAACGQFILCRRDAWLQVGGHGSIRASMHDGVRLPRIFRRGGFPTDVFDGTDLAECRMYRGWGETWRGFTKNAYEGLGHPALLAFITVLHLGGHVAPWIVAALGITGFLTLTTVGWAMLATAIAAQLVLRARLAARFRQSWIGAALHPIGQAMLTVIQWWSLVLHLTGRRSWRGRTA